MFKEIYAVARFPDSVALRRLTTLLESPVTQMLNCRERAVFEYLRVTLTSNGFKISPHQQNIHPSLNQRAMRHPAPVIILMSDTTLSPTSPPTSHMTVCFERSDHFSLPTIVTFV